MENSYEKSFTRNMITSIYTRVTSQIILPTRKQLWGGIILLAVLAFAILFLSVLMLWLMISYYENIFLILFIFSGSLSLPVLAVMVTYIWLLL